MSTHALARSSAHRSTSPIQDCYARFTDCELVIGNAHTERRWHVRNGLLYPASLRDLTTQREWLLPDTDFASPTPAVALIEESRHVRFEVRRGKFGTTQQESLVAELIAQGHAQRLHYCFQVFPSARGISVQLKTVSHHAPATSGIAGEPTQVASGVETDAIVHEPRETATPDVLDSLALTVPHYKLVQVTLRDQTDDHNELAHENEWLSHPKKVVLSGNLFFVEDVFSGDGLIILKEAPLPHARPQPCEYDLRSQDGRIALVGQGTSPDETEAHGYVSVVLPYSGGRFGRTRVLQDYQRCRRTYEPSRDGLFLSNTWGDRSRDARINADFITGEVEAGARLGVDVIQIDDGWQRGRTANSAEAAGKGGAWEDFWGSDAAFWQADEQRFPHGLEPLIAQAHEHGMQFGLWFAPDSTDDFANWQKDASLLVQMHRELGINYFKLDAIKMRTTRGERNLHAFFDMVLHESQGRITLDLDVTAEVRPGYFSRMDIGPIFVENRYTDWHSYWPHHTLRNAWKLMHYVDPLRLRVEFLNNARNREIYDSDPLAPATYAPDYLFATTMFCNPLGWFEVSNLPHSYIESVAPLVRVWKEHRAAIFSGRIYPIGEVPDGAAWTGFAACNESNNSLYALLFRETNTRAEQSFQLPMQLTANADYVTLAGEGSLRVLDGELLATIPAPRQYLFARIDNASQRQ